MVAIIITIIMSLSLSFLVASSLVLDLVIIIIIIIIIIIAIFFSHSDVWAQGALMYSLQATFAQVSTAQYAPHPQNEGLLLVFWLRGTNASIDETALPAALSFRWRDSASPARGATAGVFAAPSSTGQPLRERDFAHKESTHTTTCRAVQRHAAQWCL